MSGSPAFSRSGLEEGGGEVTEVQGPPGRRAEDEAVVFPETPILSASAARPVSLILRPLPLFAAVKVGPVLSWDSCAHAQHPDLRVEILPFEAQELADAHPGCDGEAVEGLEAIPTGRPQYPLGLLGIRRAYRLGARLSFTEKRRKLPHTHG